MLTRLVMIYLFTYLFIYLLTPTARYEWRTEDRQKNIKSNCYKLSSRQSLPLSVHYVCNSFS